MKLIPDNGYQNKMVDMMNKKYPDDRFKYYGPFGGGAGADSKTIVVNSEKYPDQRIYVRYYNKDGNEVYTDNYMSIVYEDQTRKKISGILDGLSKTFRLFYDTDDYACPNSDGPISFEEYIADKKSNIGFTAIVIASDINRAEIEKLLRDGFENGRICCYGTVYFDNSVSENELNGIPYLSVYFSKYKYYAAVDFKMADNKQISDLNWE